MFDQLCIGNVQLFDLIHYLYFLRVILGRFNSIFDCTNFYFLLAYDFLSTKILHLYLFETIILFAHLFEQYSVCFVPLIQEFYDCLPFCFFDLIVQLLESSCQ